MTKKYSVKLHTSQTVHFGNIYWTQHGYRNPLKGIYGFTREDFHRQMAMKSHKCFKLLNCFQIPQVF